MKVLVTGSDGLVGNSLKNILPNAVFLNRKDGDLTKEQDVINIYEKYKPDAVIHLAAKVGGIGGNLIGPANYFYENLLMNSFLIHYAVQYQIKKFLAFSSVCVFPEGLPFLKENLMHKGEPYYTQYAYGAAKRAIDIQIQSYKQQYGINNYSSLILTNIFGKKDNYNLKSGHVIPSLIHKIYLAKKNNEPLMVWGDGSAEREFIYVDDLAKIIIDILELEEIPQRIIISVDEQKTIKEIVNILCEVSDFKGKVIWETDKPNGQKSRPSDTSLLKSLVKTKFTDLKSSLSESYNWFEENYPNVRI